MNNFKKNIYKTYDMVANPPFIIAKNIFRFDSRTPSWITSKTASAAIGMVASGAGTVDSIFLSSNYSISRILGVFDTSTVVTPPISGTFDIYITANPSQTARTYYLIVANTTFAADAILGFSDWNDFNGSADNSAIPISSVTVAVGQTGKINFPLDSTSLASIHANYTFSAYVIAENDKNNIVTNDTLEHYLPNFSVNWGLGLSRSGDCVLTLT